MRLCYCLFHLNVLSSPTGSAELWSEQHPRHLPAGLGERRGGMGGWAERAALPGSLEEHRVGLWAVREVKELTWNLNKNLFMFDNTHHSVFFFSLRMNSCCIRSYKFTPGFHESTFCTLQALRDKEFFMFDQTLKQARSVEHVKMSCPAWRIKMFILRCALLQGCWSGGALQRQSRGCVLSVSGPQEPAEHQGAGEC